MSRDRGVRLQNALAAYLRQWWADAESAGSGRPGTDVLRTPGVVWENKTSGRGSLSIGAWIEQAQGHARGNSTVTHVVVYWPPGIGEKRPELAIAMLPLAELMGLLEDGDWTPAKPLAELRRIAHGEVMAEVRQAEAVSSFKNPDERWDATEQDLAALSRPYYEPLARGAGTPSSGTNSMPVTTAPCSGDDGQGAPKGDSPGPGPVDFVFIPANPGPAPIFDQAAADFASRHAESHADGELYEMHAHPERFRLATPPPSPPGGVAPEPPAPAMVPGEMPGQGSSSPHETAGAGADPWQAITSTLSDDPEINEWSIRAEQARCAEISRELRDLGKALSEPFKLTPWKEART